MCFSQAAILTKREQNCLTTFNNFLKRIDSCIQNKIDITDTNQLKTVVSRYVFTNNWFDTAAGTVVNLQEMKTKQLTSLKQSLSTFYGFVSQKENIHLAENLTLKPLRLSKDVFIYKRLIKFQKENSFVFFDKRSPLKILGYILFMPPIKHVNATSKIWSWTLEYLFGKFLFTSITGEVGYEYLFDTKNTK